MARTGTGPWRSFTIDGVQRKVRMVREYDSQYGSVWRDYQDEHGRVTCVQAKGPGGRRKAEKVTARTAACGFAGYF